MFSELKSRGVEDVFIAFYLALLQPILGEQEGEAPRAQRRMQAVVVEEPAQRVGFNVESERSTRAEPGSSSQRNAERQGFRIMGKSEDYVPLPPNDPPEVTLDMKPEAETWALPGCWARQRRHSASAASSTGRR